MKVLDRYVARSILLRILVASASFMLIFVIVDLFERLDTFIDHEVPVLTVTQFYLAKLPSLFLVTLPIATLVSILFALGGLARRNELIAMTASGVSLYRILVPVLVTGALVSVFALAFTLQLVPWGNHVSEDIYDHEIKGRPRVSGTLRRDLNYLGAGGRYFLMRRFDGEAATMEDVVVQQFADGTLVHRIDAKRAHWEEGQWVFEDGYIRRFVEDRVEAEPFTHRAFPEIQEVPRDFLRIVKEPDQMTLGELHEHTQRTLLSGGEVTRLRVDEHMRYSFPFASFIVMLLSAPLTAAIRRGGHAAGFGMALLVGFTYYILLEVGRTFGYNGTFPPALAAWLPNLAFVGIGAVGLWKAQK